MFWKYAANLQENTHADVQGNFIEIVLWHGCSSVNLLHIFRTPFPRNTFGWLLLYLLQGYPFKNDEKCFLFYLQSPFRSQDIFLSLLFDNGEKRLDKKDEVNYNANIAQYLMKSRQPENAIKFN